MNKDMITKLAEWIEALKEAAEDDNCFSVAWFKETEKEPFSIVGGWSEGFSEDYADLLHISKSNPSYAMCVKIIENKEPYACADYDSLDMPVDKNGEVDDTCIALELEDNPEAVAMFYLNEWERITKEHIKN